MQLKMLTFISLCVNRWREPLPDPSGRSAALLLVFVNVADLVPSFGKFDGNKSSEHLETLCMSVLTASRECSHGDQPFEEATLVPE